MERDSRAASIPLQRGLALATPSCSDGRVHADLAEFVQGPHGPLAADATEPAWNGHLLTLACPVCGGV